MPYSYPAPAFVLPHNDDGRRYAENIESGLNLEVKFCDEWSNGDGMMMLPADYLMPIHIRRCANRRRCGVIAANWCFRCMAGYPAVHLSEQDKERGHDLLT